MKKHFPILTSIITALALSAAARAEDLLDTAPVKRDPVSIRPPRNWIVDDHVKHRTLLLAGAPQRDKDEAADFQAVLTITVDVDSKIDGRAYQARVAKEFPTYTVIEAVTPITVGNLTGVTFGGTFSQNPVKLRTRQYLFSYAGNLYIIAFICLDSHWNNYVPALDASIATFTIADKK